MSFELAIAIDPGLRSTAIAELSAKGFSWRLLRTKKPDPKREIFPNEDVYRNKMDARELFKMFGNYYCEKYEAGGSIRFIASELATHARDDSAAKAMYLVQGVIAAFESHFIAGTTIVGVLPDEVKRACGVEKSAPIRLGPNPSLEACKWRAKEKTKHAKEQKFALERHVLKHFPELKGVEASVGKANKNHVFDAFGILIAASAKDDLALSFLPRKLARRIYDANIDPCASRRNSI